MIVITPPQLQAIGRGSLRSTAAPATNVNRSGFSFAHITRPFLTAFSDADPTTAPWAEVFRARVPGAGGQPHAVIAGAGHFLQEDAGDALAEVLVALLRRTFPQG